MKSEKCKLQKEDGHRPSICIFHFSFFIFHFLCATSALSQTITAEQRFLTGLRERRLFELAESYCKRELAEAYASRRRRAELTIELSRTVLESALYAKPPQREELFAAAAKVLDEARFDGPDDPWRAPVAVQRGVIELVEGELLREEAQALSAPDAALAPARDRLREAVTRLRQAQAAVEEHLRAANRIAPGATARPDEPTAVELAALKRHVDYQLARAYRNQGESYPPRSADRAAALDQATKALEQLARSETTDELTWQARLDEVVCRRLLGDLDGAERMLALIDKQSPPADVAERARAQRIRVRLDAALLDEAKKFITDADAVAATAASPEVRLAVLEWMLASSRVAAKENRTADATDWQNRAAALAKLIAERHSAHWARRAETLLAATAATAPTGDVALLVKAAESFYQQGNLDRALEIYDRAFAKAMESRDESAAITAGLTAAAIERSRKRHDAAAGRLLKLVATLPEHARAPEAHLAAIYETAERLRDPTTVEKDLLAEYSQLLDEHVRRWPLDPTAAQAWYLVGLLRRQQGNKAEAAAAFEKVVPQPLPEIMSPVVRDAAWAVVRLWAELPDDRRHRLFDVVQHLRKSAKTEAEKASAEAWLVLAEVGLGRFADAESRAKQLSAPLADDDASIVARLGELAAKRPAEVRPQIAAVTLRMIELRRLATAGAAPTRAEAQALTIAGRTAEARKVWEAVAAAHLRDGALQEEFAEFLLTQSDRDSASAAAVKWRAIERASPESSDRWYRARLGLARAYLQSGDKARAAQLIELTAALHPDLGGAEMKAKFEEVSRDIETRQ
jgi:hypothetical protein